MPRINRFSRTEDMLIDEGVVSQRSLNRREVIGCIACRWTRSESRNVGPEANSGDLVACTGLDRGSLFRVLNQLAEAEAINMGKDLSGKRGRPRSVVIPAQTVLGLMFMKSLEVPKHCPLEEDDV